MWKHKTKWLVRGGRKVRCYLCGKKILAKGDLFLFHQDTGYYSHQSCLTESTTISGNERRKAVKKIAVGAAVVGAIAAGAGKFFDVSSQSKNSPAAQTILTSQGLIPPSLTSDPANPVPGQMWYRSDAGVMAHFDGVQNRVVYSSEINDGNVNVTSKGIINGLSVLPNDGKGGFGPDTTSGATAPGQYGGTYTETTGLQEAVNYGISLSPDSYHNPGVTIQLLRGDFYLNTDLYVYDPGGNVNGISLKGSGRSVTYLIINAEDMNGIIPETGSPSPSFSGEGITFEDLAIYLSSSLSPNTVYSLVDLDNISGTKLNFINCKFNTSGNSGFSNTNILIHGGIYQSASGATSRLSFIGCVLNGANVYNDSSNNYATFIACDFNQGLNINVTTIYRAAYYFASMSFIGCNINAHIQLQGSRTIMMLVSGGNLAGEIYVTGGYHFIYINSIVLTNFTGDTAYVSISSGATLSSLILENIYTPGSELDIVDNSGTINYFKFTSANAAGSTLPIINVAISPSISANPPVSGTTYQNTNGYDIRLKIPVTYSPTTTAAATLATGISSTSTVTTSTKVSIPAGATSGEILTYDMVVPAGQYYELVVTNATIGTVEVQAA